MQTDSLNKTTFDKDLFLSLCKKCDVVLGETTTEPMIITEKVGKNMKNRKRKYKIKFRRRFGFYFNVEEITRELADLISKFNFNILSIKLRYNRTKRSYIKIKCDERVSSLVCMMIAQRINPWVEEILF